MGMIFSAYDFRGKSGENETTEYMWNVGKAFADWLTETGDIIVIKTENASTATAKAVSEGVLLQGRDVIDGGTGNNTSVINALTEKKAIGGILVDHNDLQAIEIVSLFDANGVNITADNGLNDISELIESGNFAPGPTKGTIKPLAG